MRYPLRSLISVNLAIKVLIYIKLRVASVADTVLMSIFMRKTSKCFS